FKQTAQRDRSDVRMHREAGRSSMDHVDTREMEVFKGAVHRSRRCRCRCPLELESQAHPAADDKQVKFRSRVGRPEMTLLGKRSESCHDSIEGKSFPRASDLRV